MDPDVTIRQALDAARRAGADHAQVDLALTEKTEFNVDAGRMSLLRTTGNATVNLTALTGGRKGRSAVNRTEATAVAAAAEEAMTCAAASAPDPANAIAPAVASRHRAYGPTEPDRAAMHGRLAEFLAHVGRVHPKLRLEQCVFDFTRTEKFLGNTNGLGLSQATGVYSFMAMFTAKEGTRTSSFNYVGAKRRDLALPLCAWGGLDELMRQAVDHLDPRPVAGKFSGEVVFTPHSLGDLVGGLVDGYLGAMPLIAGTSPWRGRLGQRVGPACFTLRSLPTSDRIQEGYFFTPDGFPAQDATLIDQGILQGFQLDLYAANKTGLPRATTAGGGWVVEPGTTPRADLIAGVERGLLLCRFSGGQPSENGDFSGVAKNSYLIEHGRIVHPVKETMLSGNLGTVLAQVQAISRESIDFGSEVYPWVHAGGVTISGQ